MDITQTTKVDASFPIADFLQKLGLETQTYDSIFLNMKNDSECSKLVTVSFETNDAVVDR